MISILCIRRILYSHFFLPRGGTGVKAGIRISGGDLSPHFLLDGEAGKRANSQYPQKCANSISRERIQYAVSRLRGGIPAV